MMQFRDFKIGDYNAGDLLWLGDWSPTWIALLALLGVLVIGISAWDLRNLRALRRWTLVGLRALVYMLAVLLLLEPALDLKHISKVKNDVAVLVDISRSMSLRAQADEDVTRFERAQQAVEQLKPLMERTKDSHNFHFFTVGEELRPSSYSALAGVDPTDDDSQIAGALEELAEHLDPQNLGGVVLITDGIDTGAVGRRIRGDEALDEATVELLESVNAPINTMSAASAKNLRDVAITRVLHDDFAFVHNRISVDVDLQVIGMGERSFPVELYRDGELLQTRQLMVTPDETDYRVSFEFVPEHIGKEIYTVATPEFSGEALHENNINHFLLNVIRDKIRVLQVVGEPSWDQRFLRQLLKNNPNYDLISFFILRTDESVQLVPNHEMSLIPFPTRELFEDELGSFDVIIFQNFNFGPYQMRQYLPQIADFVRDGGGFVMLGGELSFASGGYARTPIEEILPVNLPPLSSAESTINLDSFRPSLTQAGLHHPITQLAFDPGSNKKIWGELARWRGSNIVGSARSGATVLAQHPTLRTSGGEAMPVITVSEVGKGRSMALTSDSTWRWAFEQVGSGGVGREYQAFWNSAIRWLIQDPELKLIKVEAPRDIHPPGEPTEARVRLVKSDYTPAADVTGTIEVLRRDLHQVQVDKEERPDPSSATPERRRESVATVEFSTDHRGEARVEIPVPDSGIYELVAEAPGAAQKLVDRDTFLALPDIKEYREIIPRDELLRAFSTQTGGAHAELPGYQPDSLRFDPPRLVKVNHRNVIQLWDHFLIFFVIIALLSTEWALRRRWGRL